MALINCPECGREVSDKAVSCPGCGYPLQKSEIPRKEEEETESNGKFCPVCGYENHPQAEYCLNCDEKLVDHVTIREMEAERKTSVCEVPEVGIIRQYNGNALNAPSKGFFGTIESMYKRRCPRCFSEEVSPVTRTRTTVNLNPLHPFTLVKHKAMKKTDWVCNNCGKVFR